MGDLTGAIGRRGRCPKTGMKPSTLRSALLTGVDSADRPSSSWLGIFERIAAMLSERWGVQVVMRGTEAHTDGRKIVLPVVPDNAPAELIGAVHGTLDHEAGHVIFSEFFPLPDPLEKNLVNALEDARIEERLIAMWPGCAANLRACNEFFCTRLDEAGWPVSLFHKFCIALYFAERGLDRHWFVAKWIDSCDAIQPHLRVAREILAREPVHKCATTTEVLVLARKILAAVRDLIEEERERSKEPKGPEEDGPTGDSDAGESDASSTEEPAEADEPEADAAGEDEGCEDESDDSDHAHEGDLEEDGGAPSADSAQGEGDDAEERAGTPGSLGDDSEPEHMDSGEPDEGHAIVSTPEPCEDITDVAAADLERDGTWTVKRFLCAEAKEALDAADGAYLVYTTEHDKVTPAPDGDRAAYQRMIQAIRGDVMAIKRTLARTLLSSRKARWESGRARGKVDPGALHKIPVGIDRNVFRQRELARAFNTRVSLLVDHSGSMIAEKRMPLAAHAASVFSEVLTQLRIPFEVLGFTSGTHWDGRSRFSAATHEDRTLFARWGALRTIVYKDFAEDFRRASGRLVAMSSFAAGEANYDGESLLVAARRLAQASVPGERRILFVFSDGMPCGTVIDGHCLERQQAHLHRAIREIRATGTELFGIGIESDAVSSYYPEYVVVNSIADLPREAMRALDTLLRRGLNKHAA